MTATSRSSHNSAPLGRVLMVQGTSSHAGKTTIVAALCRLFARAGYRVAPFKAQNMSNNAAVTATGGEVGRAQAMQARAAGVPVTVDMNPVLLKPQSDRTSQIVVLGAVHDTRDAREFYALRDQLWPIVTGALDRLRAEFDLVVVEGAGSPAEINLAQYDIVNMRVARYADAPVLLVGDIDRGGVFAALYGTYALLQPEERALFRGFVINKFRGDPSLLDPGFEMLEARTGVPTLGVIPWLDLSALPAEDALDWDSLRQRAHADALLDIAIMRLPRVANLDEFQPLANEPGVRVRFVGEGCDMGEPDLIIIPGTKSTMADLAWLRSRELASAIADRHARGTPVFGICGGFQMLGRRIVDHEGAEAHGAVSGLDLLPVVTEFAETKVTRRVQAEVCGEIALWRAATGDNAPVPAMAPIDVYEIHMGRTTALHGEAVGAAPFRVHDGSQTRFEGASSVDGRVVGTYLHGLLEHRGVRRRLLEALARQKGVMLPEASSVPTVDDALDRLADAVALHLDMRAIAGFVSLGWPAR